MLYNIKKPANARERVRACEPYYNIYATSRSDQFPENTMQMEHS